MVDFLIWEKNVADEPSTKRRIRKVETVRERAERSVAAADKPKVRRIRKTAGAASRPFRAAHRIGQKEYYLPMPDNRVGKFLNKRRRFTPRFIREAWAELRQVEWPNARMTARLTIAVFIFALFFGLLVTAVDFGLGKLFEKVFL